MRHQIETETQFQEIMKKFILAFAMIFAAGTAVQAQSAEKSNAPTIEFEKSEHDFGTIEQNGDGTYEFVFTNNGKEPLLISNAKGSCGCTVPVWPREPIAPGESGSIKVKYDTKRVGPFNKSVTITSNAEPATTVIRIKGNVKKVEAAAAPTKKAAEGAPTAPKL